jgi:hypothetical protein
MRFSKWLWHQFLTRPGRVALAGLVMFVAGELIQHLWVRGAGEVVAACGAIMMSLSLLIFMLVLFGFAVPEGTGKATRMAVDVAVVLFLGFFPLLVVTLATSASPSVITALGRGQRANGVGGFATTSVGACCLFATPVLLVAIPEALRRHRPWSGGASELAKTLVPSWLAALAATATWFYIFLQHFFGGPLAGPSVGLVALGGLAVAALLAPVYQFVARSCWEHGVLVVLDPVRWRDAWRKVRENIMVGERIDAEIATQPLADPASQDFPASGPAS